MNQKTLKTNVDNIRFVQELMGDAFNELQRAARKHPLFPKQLLDRYHEVNLKGMLNVARSNCDNPEIVTGYDVLNEEYLEFLEAVVKKDKEEAIKELVQVIAMCLRIGLHLDHYLGLEDHSEQCGETIQPVS